MVQLFRQGPDLRLHLCVVHHCYIAVSSGSNIKNLVNRYTILHLAHSRLDIVQGQVADLVFQTVEIHLRALHKAAKDTQQNQLIN
jgi:putative NIF3 family GTP cyclohydrolase 1 type 2